ncbi:MAG: 50S ribosomal protein L17 [Saprospiraceae bacterium]|nr:50S ribosomal protein L17 [Saprospiraceae bacterium]
MRHGKKFNHLGRKKGHRRATMANLAISLVEHKRINTTLAKAKALRTYIEPLITKSKVNSTHSRRTVFSYLQNKESIKELFGPIAAAIGTRPGGYTRVIKLGFRPSDGAEMAMIELVDFNTVYSNEKTASKGRRRRRRRGGSGPGAATIAATAASAEEE